MLYNVEKNKTKQKMIHLFASRRCSTYSYSNIKKACLTTLITVIYLSNVVLLVDTYQTTNVLPNITF